MKFVSCYFIIKKHIWLLVITAAITVLNPSLLKACPGCNAALDATLGRGFNMSILFLIAMPFFVVGSIVVGFLFIRNQHHQNPANSMENIQNQETEESKN
ncbi:MAG: hypothetical protein ACE5HI_01675 [bacterium]